MTYAQFPGGQTGLSGAVRISQSIVPRVPLTQNCQKCGPAVADNSAQSRLVSVLPVSPAKPVVASQYLSSLLSAAMSHKQATLAIILLYFTTAARSETVKERDGGQCNGSKCQPFPSSFLLATPSIHASGLWSWLGCSITVMGLDPGNGSLFQTLKYSQG